MKQVNPRVLTINSGLWPKFLALAAIDSVLFAVSLNRFRRAISQMA